MVKQTYEYTLFSVELDPFQRDGSKIDGLDLSLRTRNKRVKQINMEQVKTFTTKGTEKTV